jgi:uncharacterized protein YraI
LSINNRARLDHELIVIGRVEGFMRKELAVVGSIILLVGLLLAGLTAAVTAQSNNQIAVVGAHGAVLQQDDGQPVVTLAPGALLMVQGRSADGQQLYVQTEARQDGWVALPSLLVVNVNALPVVTSVVITGTTANPVTLSAPPTPTVMSATTTGLAAPILVATPADISSAPPAASAVAATVTLTNSRLNLRAGPTTAYPITARAAPGSRWTVIGQTKAGDWLQLQASSGADGGWATAAYLLVEGSGAVPVVSAFPILQPTATALAVGRILQPTAVPPSGEPAALPAPVAPATAPSTAGRTGLVGTLAFQDQIGGAIYLYDLATDQLTPLTSGIDPAISPDGQRIAFTRDGGAGGLYVINRDGSGEQKLYGDHPLLRAPSWSPDGRWIVFSRANGFEDCRVVRGSVCLPDDAIIESLPEELQGDAEVHNLVKGIPNQRTYHTTLARIAPDGSDYRDIPALDYAAAPDWNSGGIVYQSNAGIQRTADEADVRSFEIANDPLVGYFHDPDWQPGGGRIVFHRKQGSHWQIYAVNPDGSGLVALTRPVTALVDELPSNVSPAWSPDGQQIIYLSNRNSIESAGAWHLWVMNADGSDQRMLPIDVVFNYTFSSEQMVSWAQ